MSQDPSNEHVPPRMRTPPPVPLPPRAERRRVSSTPSHPLPFVPSATTTTANGPASFFPSLVHLSLQGNRSPIGLLTLGLLFSFFVLRELKMGGPGTARSLCANLARALTSSSSTAADSFDCFTAIAISGRFRFEGEYEDTDVEDAEPHALSSSLKSIILQAGPTLAIRVVRGGNSTAQMNDWEMLKRM